MGKSYSSREVMQRLKLAGWTLVRTSGSHHHFQHPFRRGTVTVPHPKKTMKTGTLKSIEKQSGVSF